MNELLSKKLIKILNEEISQINSLEEWEKEEMEEMSFDIIKLMLKYERYRNSDQLKFIINNK